MDINELIKRCFRIAGVSFVTGTAILILYFLTNWYFLAISAVPLILVLVVGNSIFLLRLIKLAIKYSEKRIESLKAGLAMILNIPVALFYLYFVLTLVDTVVIGFKNGTSKDIKNLSVTGCHESKIGDLRPGGVDFEWITITQGCIEKSILIQYEVEGSIKREIVYSYVVDGRRIYHNIGDQGNLLVSE